MKVETVEVKAFKPIRITLETQDEVDRLFAIMNFVPIKNALDLYEDNWALLWHELRGRKTECYLKYHCKLDTILKCR